MRTILRTNLKPLLLLVLFVLPLLSLAQTTITGTVLSDDDNQPLPGVNIIIKGTTTGSTTDIGGNYSLSVPDPNAVLLFSFVGYQSQEIVVGNRSRIDLSLLPDISQLEEIVVVGYGAVRKSDLTGAVSSIKGEELVTVPAVNPIEALQGKVPGMQITNSSGAPGSSPVVRIRGVSTPGNSAPIYVVDGVILNNIDFLNAADIQSIEVLKDASATSIYGNRGANGVIIVTTRLGSVNRPAEITVASEFSIQTQQNRIDLLNGRQFAEVQNAINPGTFNNLDALPNIDWQDLVFETGTIQNHQVSVSGASDKNQYHVSLSYFNQQGTIPESEFERVTLRINERLTPKENFSLGANVSVSPFIRENTINSAPFNAYRASPIIEPFNDNGDFNEVDGVGNILADFLFNTDNTTRGLTTVGQIFAEVKFLKGFSLKTSLGTELFWEENEAFVPEFFVSAAQQNPVNNFAKNTFRRTSWIWENTLNYDREIDKHRINAVIGYTLQESRNERLNIIGRDLFRTGDDFRYIDQNNIDPVSVRNDVRDPGDYFNMISYLGRINYSYDERYIATFTFRRDGSSKFLGDNRYNLFPAFGLGWNMINESFIQFPGIITDLKLRASWGQGGNDKIDYLRAYNLVGNNFNAVLGETEQQFFGQSDSEFGNPDLEWETVEQIDIGLEIGLLDGRFTAELDYYIRDTDGILIGLSLPDYLGNGAQSVFFNAGAVTNKGLEFNLQWRDQIGDFNYNVGIIGATLDNEMTRVSGVEGADFLFGPRFNNQNFTRTEAGQPIGAFWGYIVDGVFQDADEITSLPSISGAQPGDLIFRDVNDDGEINGDDRTFIGSSIPDLTYGINLGASYKNFSLNLLFQGQAGNDIFNAKETVRPAPYNYEAHVFNYWRGPGTSNSEPRPTIGGNNFLPSTRFVENGGFFRLRTITLAYNLPQIWLNKAGIKSSQVYVRGNNVFTITDFSGYNPEVADGNPLLNGLDRGIYPVASIYSLGINLTF
ncbi:MAG: TonB-dependent receptor [Bacteroidota bacterium]